MRRRALAAIGLLLLAPQAVVVRAQEVAGYELRTVAVYRALPEERRIEVRVGATLANRTPDPEGGFSVFTAARLAIHDQASDVRAEDAGGERPVEVTREGDVTVATVSFAEPVRYDSSTDFTLVYSLPDAPDARLRATPSIIAFPAWGFGTSSSVAIELPVGYRVAVDGDEVRVADEGPPVVRLESGPIAAPGAWVALVTADRPDATGEMRATIPIDSATVDLRVQHWQDDREWGERMVRLLERGIPALAEAIGLPYLHDGPLVLREAVSAGAAALEEAGSGEAGAHLEIGYDQPPFTALHGAAHAWLGPRLFGMRWMHEGLASHYAAAVAPELGVEPPYDPAAERDARADLAVPLDAWPAIGRSAPDQDIYGYPAAWALIGAIAERVGDDALREALTRIAAGVDAYDPVPASDAGIPAPAIVEAADSRVFLDQLESVSGEDLTDLFAERVFDESLAGRLAVRRQARSAYIDLLAAAGDWGAPDPIRRAMVEWRFEEALSAVGESRDWLRRRDALLEEASASGLGLPDRLRDRYRQSGGSSEGTRELEVIGQVVDRYAAVAARLETAPSLLERIGTIGSSDAAESLEAARGGLAVGDLVGAADALTAAESGLETAGQNGIVRLAAATAILLTAVGLGVILIQRRRRPRPG